MVDRCLAKADYVGSIPIIHSINRLKKPVMGFFPSDTTRLLEIL